MNESELVIGEMIIRENKTKSRNNSIVIIDDDIELITASSRGDIDAVKLLLSEGIDVNLRNNNGVTALYAAAVEGHTDLLHHLLDNHADINSQTIRGHTPLIISAYNGQIDVVRALLERDANVNTLSYNGNTVLHACAIQGQVDCLREVLNKYDDEAFINIKNNSGSSAMYMAAYGGYIDCQRLLLNKGAIIDPSDIDDIEDQEECKQMMLDELQHRCKRIEFDLWIKHHIQYKLYINDIYLKCYPSGDLRPAEPPIGWPRAEAIRNKYYYDEILFYVHLCVANVLAKKTAESKTSLLGFLSSKNDKTFTILYILASKFKEFL